MSNEQSPSESLPQKRQRRVKQDPQFIFENPIIDKTETNKPIKQSYIQDDTIGADLYEPGDVVWSKLGSFPWWPALIYRYDAEDGIYTRTLNSNNKPKRQFFVYFYGKYLEYAWLSTRSLLKYAGLTNFIQNAETAVQQASTKSEQIELANRYQLKVSMKKRVQWDEAIELADHALTMTRDGRIKEFQDLLKDGHPNKKHSKIDIRHRRVAVDKKSDGEIPMKRHARLSSTSSSYSCEIPIRDNLVEKLSSNENNAIDSFVQQSLKKNRNRTFNAQLKTFDTDTNHLTTRERKQSSSTRNNVSLPLIQRKRKSTDDREYESQYSSSFPLMHYIQANLPPLSNYELKQIVQGLLQHPQESTLTFDEAQTFATDKAVEIVYENYHYRMDHISSEWFYDAILLKYPSIIFKYRSWFKDIKPDIIPNETDVKQLKQWQIVLMIEAQINAEQHSINGIK